MFEWWPVLAKNGGALIVKDTNKGNLNYLCLWHSQKQIPIKYERFALFRLLSSQVGKMTILETKQSAHTLLVPHIRSNISTVMAWYHGNKRTTT